MADEKNSIPTPEEEGAEFTADLVTLTDEEGKEHEFELVDTLEHNGKSYVALLASPENPDELVEDDGNLVIMKIVSEDGDDEVLELIEDDDEFEEISEIFMDRLSDLYEFDEDEEE
jgi:uncharacterized protein YrzB (UPF0473 family)